MRPVAIFVVVIACLAITIATFILIIRHSGEDLDKQSQAYVDEIVPKIAKGWNADELLKQASPELLKAAPENRIRVLFDTFSKKLGPLKNYEGSKGQANIFFTFLNGRTVTATYVSNTTFEKGAATIETRIIFRNKNWQVLRFFVNSDALLK